MDEARQKKIEELVERNRKNRKARWVEHLERTEKCEETAKKVARLLAESQAKYNDIDTVFQMAKKFLAVDFVEDDM